MGLPLEDIQAAWDYYREHPAEIDEDIRENEEDMSIDLVPTHEQSRINAQEKPANTEDQGQNRNR